MIRLILKKDLKFYSNELIKESGKRYISSSGQLKNLIQSKEVEEKKKKIFTKEKINKKNFKKNISENGFLKNNTNESSKKISSSRVKKFTIHKSKFRKKVEFESNPENKKYGINLTIQNFAPLTNNSTYSKDKTRYLEIIKIFLQQKKLNSSDQAVNNDLIRLIPLNDLLFVLSNPQLGKLNFEIIDVIFKSLLFLPEDKFIFKTKHFNYFILHVLNTSTEIIDQKVLDSVDTVEEALDMELQKADPEATRLKVQEFIINLKELNLEFDAVTYSLLVHLNFYVKNFEECFQLFNEAKALNLPLLTSAYVALIKILNKKFETNEDKEDDINLNKSKIWEVYTALGKAGVSPSIKLYEEMLCSFNNLKYPKGIKKIYQTLTSLSGQKSFEKVFGKDQWSSKIFTALLENLSETGFGDEKLLNKLLFLIRIKSLQMDRDIVHALMKYWNVNGKPMASLRLQRYFKPVNRTTEPANKEYIIPNHTTYVLMLNSVLHFKDPVLLQVSVLERLYQQLLENNTQVNFFDNTAVNFKTWELSLKCLMICMEEHGEKKVRKSTNNETEVATTKTVGKFNRLENAEGLLGYLETIQLLEALIFKAKAVKPLKEGVQNFLTVNMTTSTNLKSDIFQIKNSSDLKNFESKKENISFINYYSEINYFPEYESLILMSKLLGFNQDFENFKYFLISFFFLKNGSNYSKFKKNFDEKNTTSTSKNFFEPLYEGFVESYIKKTEDSKKNKIQVDLVEIEAKLTSFISDLRFIEEELFGTD
ncbi:hypothetical protein HDU92_007564 [Lobulomyces angularis]|nr:hypothetical protein HDU92_007564 [Lobulomyces angularis]